VLKGLLQGKPLRHPLHTLLVHLPIGLLVLSFLFDLGSFVLGNVMVQAAFYAMVVGEFLALVVAIPGLIDWMDIRIDHPGKNPATFHMVLNVMAVGMYASNLLLRMSALEAAATPLIALLLSLAGVGLLTVSGYIGGSLVYEYGIGVGRHRRYTDMPSKTHRVAPSSLLPDGYLRLTGAAYLDEGDSMRLEFNHQVITLVNYDGRFYAIQEFCTHQFGPLSEGTFINGQVECPWHRSCFDLRTGAVTHGPAKLPLRTFDVVTEGEDIYVRVGEIQSEAEQQELERVMA
jgi:nitrite reductase/ring-hydroxylating ferredoxin subunit/uncharacterized membrane protein